MGEDGPTHQPIEQFAMIRAMPNIHLFRPADANEVVGAYHYYMKSELPVFSPSPDRTSPFCSIPRRTRSSMVLISLTIVKANLILYLPFSWFISVDFCGYRLGGLNLY